MTRGPLVEGGEDFRGGAGGGGGVNSFYKNTERGNGDGAHSRPAEDIHASVSKLA